MQFQSASRHISQHSHSAINGVQIAVFESGGSEDYPGSTHLAKLWLQARVSAQWLPSALIRLTLTKNYDQCQCQHRLVNQLLNTNILLQIYVCYDNFETLVKSGGQVGIELRSQKIFCERKYLEVFFWKVTLPADGGERLVKEISELLPHEFFSKILTLLQAQSTASVFCKKGSIRFIAANNTIVISRYE